MDSSRTVTYGTYGERFRVEVIVPFRARWPSGRGPSHRTRQAPPLEELSTEQPYPPAYAPDNDT
ncbi:MAG: hypothetical protein AB1486_14170 [Planctomycetota bacterium]